MKCERLCEGDGNEAPADDSAVKPHFHVLLAQDNGHSDRFPTRWVAPKRRYWKSRKNALKYARRREPDPRFRMVVGCTMPGCNPISPED